MTEKTFIDEYAETIVKPGHGYGQGAVLIRRFERALKGFETSEKFTGLTLEDNRTRSRTTCYLSEDGFVINAIIGHTGIRWAVVGGTNEVREIIRSWQKHSGVIATGVLYGSALADCYELIRDVRRVAGWLVEQ